MELRPYQTKAIDMLYDWFEKHKTGHPVMNMPGGSGKSVCIGYFAMNTLQNWPETRILMLVSRKELIQQNLSKLLKLWPGAPVGVCSASLGRKQIGDPITYAGIASIWRKASDIGHTDICIIDECHELSNEQTGMYRKLMADLMAINPYMRVVGWSASPYRMKHGLLTEGKDAIFTDIIEPVTIKELLALGHLFPLRSKQTDHVLSTEGLKVQAGDYVQSQMEEAFNTVDHNEQIVDEIIRRAEGRKHWLIFCSGIDHSAAMSEVFRAKGITSETLTSEATNTERERILNDFHSGRTQALCNVSILSVGYDFEELDCIAVLRATKSPGLYLQISVRGMRVKKFSKDCLYLDFSGNVQRHGPITDIQPPSKKGTGTGKAPTKTCPECAEIVHAAVRVCPCCGAAFPAPEVKPMILHNDDIMGLEPLEMAVTSWQWAKYTGQSSQKEMLRITYYGGLFEPTITEYLCVLHGGQVGQRAQFDLARMMKSAGVEWESEEDLPLQADELEMIADALSAARPPDSIQFRRDGKYHRVLSRHWERQLQSIPSASGRGPTIYHVRASEVETRARNQFVLTPEELAELPF